MPVYLSYEGLVCLPGYVSWERQCELIVDIFRHPRFMEFVFGLGFWEIAIIFGAALLFFGPSKLPELARTLGRGLREFRNATDDFRNTIDAELHEQKPASATSKTEPEKLPETIARSNATSADNTQPTGTSPEKSESMAQSSLNDDDAKAAPAEDLPSSEATTEDANASLGSEKKA